MSRRAGRAGVPVGLVVFPGAGTGADHPGLRAVEGALAGTVPVRRVDFAYRRAGRRAPPRATTLVGEVVDAVTAAADALGTSTAALAVGGRSMGGRVASMAVAQGLDVAALVLIAYPLHPPGRPERARTEHLGAIGVPTLFVSGTRDAFATPAELAEAAAMVAGPVTTAMVDGAGHGLERRDDEVAGIVARWMATASGPRG